METAMVRTNHSASVAVSRPPHNRSRTGSYLEIEQNGDQTLEFLDSSFELVRNSLDINLEISLRYGSSYATGHRNGLQRQRGWE
jgi:hypothetical protein